MNKEMLETLRDLGKVPDLFYYQLNGKSANENFREQRNNFLELLENSDEPETIKIITESKVKE